MLRFTSRSLCKVSLSSSSFLLYLPVSPFCLIRSRHTDNRSSPDQSTEILDGDYSIPGKYLKYFAPSDRDLRKQQKEQQLLDRKSAASSTTLLSSSPYINDVQQYTLAKRTRLAKRIVRAIHHILYSPAFAAASTNNGMTTSSWRVDKVDVSDTGRVYVYWVPNHDFSMDNQLSWRDQAAWQTASNTEDNQTNSTADSIEAEVVSMSKLLKKKLIRVLGQRTAPFHIQFIRRDLKMEAMLDMVKQLVDQSTTLESTKESTIDEETDLMQVKTVQVIDEQQGKPT